MIINKKILLEYAKVIKTILSLSPTDTDRKNIVETLQNLTFDYRKKTAEYDLCEMWMMDCFIEAIPYVKNGEYGTALQSIDSAMDCYYDRENED